MRRIVRPCWLAAMVSCLPGVVAAGDGGGPPVPALADVIDVLRTRAARIESLSVEHDLTAVALEKPEVVNRLMGLAYLEHQKVRYAFKGNKRYFKVVEPREVDPVVPVGEDGAKAAKFRTIGTTETAFDGKVLRRNLPGSDSADIRAIDNAGDDSRWFPQEYMLNLGLMLPDPLSPGGDDARRAFRLPDAFTAGRGSVEPAWGEVDGHRCAVVSVAKRQRYWLDPALGYSVRKFELYDSQTGLLAERRLNHEFAEIAPGVWLPKTCWFEWCGFPRLPEPYRGKPMVRYVLGVTKVSVNDVPDSLFTLEIPPGTMVVDSTHLTTGPTPGRAVSYVMPANPEAIDQTIERATRDQSRGRGRGKVATIVWVILAANLVVIVVVVVAAVLRRQRRRMGG